jgi:hypothetical protein
VKKVNLNEIKEEPWQSPCGKYAVSFKGISEALGREPASLDLSKRHPFDLEWNRLPAGKMQFPLPRSLGPMGIVFGYFRQRHCPPQRRQDGSCA